MSHLRLRPISPCFHYVFPDNRPTSPWFSGWNPFCIRGLVRGRVAEPEPEPVGTVFIWGLWNRNRIRNTVPVPVPKSPNEYGSGSGYKEMKQKTQKNLLEV
jgi:hypothetical protein